MKTVAITLVTNHLLVLHLQTHLLQRVFELQFWAVQFVVQVDPRMMHLLLQKAIKMWKEHILFSYGNNIGQLFQTWIGMADSVNNVRF